ncbi:decapping endonuclease targeting mRNA, partial [Cladochytrium tenue]
CWLAGIPHIVLGFRDDGGRLRTIEPLRTAEIPRSVRGGPAAWDPVVGINFADALLRWLAAEVNPAAPGGGCGGDGVVYHVGFRGGNGGGGGGGGGSPEHAVIELNVLDEPSFVHR